MRSQRLAGGKAVLALYHLHHWNPQCEVINFNDFLHIAIKLNC